MEGHFHPSYRVWWTGTHGYEGWRTINIRLAFRLEDYKLMETHVLDGLYQGSVKNLISALYDGEKLSDKDIAELKQWFRK